VQAGGVEALSTLLKSARAGNPNTVTVGAGDLISASPIVSSLLADEPSIEALNGMGLEFSSVGNHEFDRGFKELLRVQKGGCDGVDPTQTCKFDNPSAGQNRILQVSDGFSYTWDNAKPKGEKVDASSLKLGGNPLNPAAVYRVTVNNFLADGGDGFTALKEGNNRLGGGQDIDAFAAYLKAQSDAGKPLQPGAVNRITRVN